MNIAPKIDNYSLLLKRSNRIKNGLESENSDKLKKACKDFEAIFLNIMFKEMRKTVNEKDDFFANSGSKIFSDMLDNEYSKKAASGEGLGLWKMIYKNLQTVQNSQNHDHVDLKSDFKTINKNNGTELNKKEKIEKIIFEKSKKYGVDPLLIRAIAKNESGFNDKAVSPVGAKGVMQLMDSTASEMGVKNPFDPEENIEGGVKYFSFLLNKFGDIKLAVAAYNAGPGNVRKYGGIPPFKETERYVGRVLNDYRDAKLKKSGI